MELAQLTQIVLDAFRDEAPNGWALGWDRDRFYDELAEQAAPWQLINCTSYDYDFCNCYSTTIPFAHGAFELALQISHIAPVYSYHWMQRNFQHRNPVPDDPQRTRADLEKRLEMVLNRNGFAPLPEAWHDVPIAVTTLELSEPGSATLSKCLFEDYSG